MPLTFIHTADWHLGRVYRRLGPRTYESAQWRLEAVQRIFDLAAESGAAFILVAGDVFDSGLPAPRIVQETVGLLGDAPAPVVLIPGNHDFCAEGSVWFRPDFADALKGVRHVHLATEAGPLELDGATILPCPVTARQSSHDWTAWIAPQKRGDRVRIGLAHGGLRGYYGEDAAASTLNAIAADCADRCGLDYLALGDYHAHTASDHPAAKARSYYAGTPECGDRGDRRPGYALRVDIAQPGAEPQVTPHFVGRVTPDDWGTILLQAGHGFDALRQRLAKVEKPATTLVRARLQGCLTEAEKKDLDAWLNETRDAVLGADIDTRVLFTEPSADDFKALKLEMPEQRILDLLDAPLEADDLPGVTSREHVAAWSHDAAARREARALFYQLLRGA